jgi:gamma-glutamyltranspeptidase/glutathione hydrolase
MSRDNRVVRAGRVDRVVRPRRPGRDNRVAAAALALALAAACRPQVAPPVPPSATTRPALTAESADPHAPFNYVGRKGMVVAAHPLAAQAGLDMLKAGGNAVDAAVATAFALNAAEPFASGIGGGGFMLIYIARSHKVTVVNFREKAPAAATPGMFAGKGKTQAELRQERGTAVGVPGMLAGWSYALRAYGTRTLAEAAARAIEIAERGFPVGATFSQIDKDEYEKLVKNAGETTRYLNGGIPYEPGEVFRNPELAATLRLIAARGVEEFYKGGIARKIVDAVRAKGGAMTLEDLAAYRAVEVEPISGTYKGALIYTIPPPGTGGLHLLQLLSIAEGWPLREWGHNSPDYIHHLAEAMRFIFADKERYDGDPDFVSLPLERLLSKDHAREIREKISAEKVAGVYKAGPFDPVRDRKENTTHVGVIDKDGNIVALTQSINDFFGTGIVPEGTGFLLNDHMADFSVDPKSPNAPSPGHRPVSNMGPMIMFKDGTPFLSIGSPGGMRIFPSLAQIILNVTEFGMSLDEAIEAPRFYSDAADGKARPVAVEPRIPDTVLKALEALGHRITLKEAYDKYFGGAQGIMVLRDNRVVRDRRIIYGGADSRRDGVGAGY